MKATQVQVSPKAVSVLMANFAKVEVANDARYSQEATRMATPQELTKLIESFKRK